jgi:hypothetical protein
MGFLSASVSFTRYRLMSEAPDTLWSEVVDRLKRYAFRDIDDTADERSFGWVCYDNWLDPYFKEAPPQKGEHLAFSLRLDTRRVSPAVFKKHFSLALGEALEHAKSQGKAHISRDRKQEIREQVNQRLMSRTLPIPAVFEVAWNVPKNVIYLGSTRQKIKSLFEDLFTLTFDLHVEPLTPYALGLSLAGEEKRPVLDSLEPADFA